MAEDVKIGLLGFGNVGTGVYKILKHNARTILHRDDLNIEIKKILVRDVNKPRKVDADRNLFTDDIDEIVNDPEISIIAEFMGGVEPARKYILKALNNGKTVVTANKEVLSKHWPELEDAAKENNVGLYYEASVAGGIPIINVVFDSLQANNITQIMGIINGTTNYILTKMTDENRTLDDVLKEAQTLGLAEPNPSADIEGFDAVYKLSILSSICFHSKVPVDHIYREGITGITPEDIQCGKELGYVIKLLAIGKKEGNSIQARVHPTFIPMSHPLASVRNSYNAIFLKGDAVGDIMLYGRGAGDTPTGSAVVSDIINACHAEKHRYTTFVNEDIPPKEIEFNKNWKTDFFIRLTVKDKPGVLAKIAGIFSRNNVSLASVIQKEHTRELVPLIFLTHGATEVSMENAIKEIKLVDDVIQIDNIIRVER